MSSFIRFSFCETYSTLSLKHKNAALSCGVFAVHLFCQHILEGTVKIDIFAFGRTTPHFRNSHRQIISAQMLRFLLTSLKLHHQGRGFAAVLLSFSELQPCLVSSSPCQVEVRLDLFSSTMKKFQLIHPLCHLSQFRRQTALSLYPHGYNFPSHVLPFLLRLSHHHVY